MVTTDLFCFTPSGEADQVMNVDIITPLDLTTSLYMCDITSCYSPVRLPAVLPALLI